MAGGRAATKTRTRATRGRGRGRVQTPPRRGGREGYRGRDRVGYRGGRGGEVARVAGRYAREGGRSGYRLEHAPGRGPGESYLARHPYAPLVWVARQLWRHRWPLAPVFVAGTAVVGVGVAPGWTVLLAAGGAGVMEVAASWPRVRTIGGRAWLSARERRTAALGLAAAAGWVLVADAAPGLGWRPLTVLLAAVLGVPAWRWWTARRPEKETAGVLSPLATRLVTDWESKVASAAGPKPLRASTVVDSSVVEPVEGTVVVVVRLCGVHPSAATNKTVRQGVEVALGLPLDSVRLESVRDDGAADRVKVTLGASRHLEAAPTTWPGPVLGDDGAVPVALDAGGATVSIHLFNKDGVEHGLISGTSGMGKGGSTVVVTLPGVLSGVLGGGEVVFYADGKRGMSAPEIHPVMTRLALDEQRWGQAVDIVHAVMCGREERYGKAKIKRFEAVKTSDPVVTLLLDEATTLAGVLSAKRVRKVAEIAQRGRATGVRLIQVSQSVRSDMIVGGVPVRDLLTGAGFGISHKPGGASAARLATDGIPVPGLVEALQSLPPEPGMAVITRRGRVLATQARVFDAEEQAIAQLERWVADGGRPLELAGADLAAAGAAYTDWHADQDDVDQGDVVDEALAPAGEADRGDRATKLSAKAEQIKEWILATLDEAGTDGARGADLEKTEGAPSRATLYRYLNRLLGDGAVTNTGGIWRLTGLPLDELDAELDDEATDDEFDTVERC